MPLGCGSGREREAGAETERRDKGAEASSRQTWGFSFVLCKVRLGSGP